MQGSQARAAEKESRIATSDQAVIQVNHEIEKVKELIQVVDTSAHQQIQVIDDIDQSVVMLSSLSDKTLTNIQDVDNSIHLLMDQLSGLAHQVKKYTV